MGLGQGRSPGQAVCAWGGVSDGGRCLSRVPPSLPPLLGSSPSCGPCASPSSLALSATSPPSLVPWKAPRSLPLFFSSAGLASTNLQALVSLARWRQCWNLPRRRKMSGPPGCVWLWVSGSSCRRDPARAIPDSAVLILHVVRSPLPRRFLPSVQGFGGVGCGRISRLLILSFFLRVFWRGPLFRCFLNFLCSWQSPISSGGERRQEVWKSGWGAGNRAWDRGVGPGNSSRRRKRGNWAFGRMTSKVKPDRPGWT